jgi:hypothetical protein
MDSQRLAGRGSYFFNGFRLWRGNRGQLKFWEIEVYLKAIAAAGALALAATAANATDTVTFTPLGASSISLLTPTSGVAGTDYIQQTGSNGQGAAPELAGGADTGAYLSILGGGTATIDFAASVSEYKLYVGSLDSYNTISFTGTGGTSYDGDALLLASGADANSVGSGNQTSKFTNGVFTFTFDAPVTGVVLSSTTNSLEVGGVPEPATWAVMLLGFGGIGASMRNARRRHVAATA